MIVELDGGQHAESERDRRRDAFLAQEGWTVLRIWNSEVDANPDGVFEAITSRAAECRGGTHPCRKSNRPVNGPIFDILPSREGRTRRRRWGDTEGSH